MAFFSLFWRAIEKVDYGMSRSLRGEKVGCGIVYFCFSFKHRGLIQLPYADIAPHITGFTWTQKLGTLEVHLHGRLGPPFLYFNFTFFSIVVLKITGSLKKTNNKMLNSTNVQIS